MKAIVLLILLLPACWAKEPLKVCVSFDSAIKDLTDSIKEYGLDKAVIEQLESVSDRLLPVFAVEYVSSLRNAAACSNTPLTIRVVPFAQGQVDPYTASASVELLLGKTHLFPQDSFTLPVPPRAQQWSPERISAFANGVPSSLVGRVEPARKEAWIRLYSLVLKKKQQHWQHEEDTCAPSVCSAIGDIRGNEDLQYLRFMELQLSFQKPDNHLEVLHFSGTEHCIAKGTGDAEWVGVYGTLLYGTPQNLNLLKSLPLTKVSLDKFPDVEKVERIVNQPKDSNNCDLVSKVSK